MSSKVAEEFIENYDGLAVTGFQFAADKKGNVVGAPKGDVAMIEKVNEIIIAATEADLFLQWYEAAAEEAKSQGL
jgi:hypothetical protein